LAWDATCPDTFAKSHIIASSTLAGSAAKKSETNKIAKYSDILSGIDFTPVAIETTGVWGEEGLLLVKELGRRMAILNYDKRSTTFLKQRISLAVQRGNAYSIAYLRP
jgi:hypothetical protein